MAAFTSLQKMLKSQGKKCWWYISPRNTSSLCTVPQVVLWFTYASGLCSQGWKSLHQLPMSHFMSQTAPLAPDSDLFLQAHVTVSVPVAQEDRICSVSSEIFCIHYLHRLASNILISLIYYSLILTSCTHQLYFLVFWQQHLKLTF